MKADELRELATDELERKKAELKDQLFKLRFQNELGQLENFAKMSSLRKDIARIETILQEDKAKGRTATP
ncbi:MAG: 50S ribosomal protein L29 [Candidatus Aminicenantes bacterium]|jgi:large subunit ribosomal protein L29|nr:50S ribosomal protein L29 [Candidatus Aminicenantes bacterium]